MPNIIRDWASDLPLRHQGVLIVAARGCDGVPKENSAKPLTRAIRHAFMHCADEREIAFPAAFMQDGFTDAELVGFLKDWDHYPTHFVQHIMHACEVIGYKHPDRRLCVMFRDAYMRICHKLHVFPEPEGNMDHRLTEDRIAAYGSNQPPE